MSEETIAIASDHAGVEMKGAVKAELEAMGHRVLDLGTQGTESVDYPDFADAVAEALRQGRASRGVLVCGTGIGISMAANRHRHVRAAVCHDATSARLARAPPFDGGRHARRVAKLS
jgi:ribose 5-phosphate isomerase B